MGVDLFVIHLLLGRLILAEIPYVDGGEMPKQKINETEIFFEEHGAGLETIVFAHGLLWVGHMFENLVNYFFTIPYKEKEQYHSRVFS